MPEHPEALIPSRPHVVEVFQRGIDAENLVIVCGVFIHWLAEDNKKIYDYNYKATKDAIASAMKGSPSVQEMLAGKDKEHPFKGF